jgi:hypothetical protein
MSGLFSARSQTTFLIAPWTISVPHLMHCNRVPPACGGHSPENTSTLLATDGLDGHGIF